MPSIEKIFFNKKSDFKKFKEGFGFEVFQSKFDSREFGNMFNEDMFNSYLNSNAIQIANSSEISIDKSFQLISQFNGNYDDLPLISRHLGANVVLKNAFDRFKELKNFAAYFRNRFYQFGDFESEIWSSTNQLKKSIELEKDDLIKGKFIVQIAGKKEIAFSHYNQSEKFSNQAIDKSDEYSNDHKKVYLDSGSWIYFPPGVDLLSHCSIGISLSLVFSYKHAELSEYLLDNSIKTRRNFKSIKLDESQIDSSGFDEEIRKKIYQLSGLVKQASLYDFADHVLLIESPFDNSLNDYKSDDRDFENAGFYRKAYPDSYVATVENEKEIKIGFRNDVYTFKGEWLVFGRMLVEDDVISLNKLYRYFESNFKDIRNYKQKAIEYIRHLIEIGFLAPCELQESNTRMMDKAS